ncbi:cytochrome P450 [Patellaria atrata CBS 101060]|uniref:Cytochrome P450 n=1 Tax=Patellaria atrata CBS 101060 TaxID=1346257 RepID=A0A9P4S165_9PEZI|nr:cytochrome P450 [Patellaria atrata CBS 101060]
MATITNSSAGILSVQPISYKVIFAAVVTIYALYLFGLGIYRVYFDALSHYPGPKLAALTTWYQAYYDLYYHGQWFKKLGQLHEQYGPIIRVNPHELHISDPNFIDILFTGASKKRDKYKWLGRSILLPDSTGGTVHHDLHRKRRASLSPFFSKEKIRRLEPSIQRAVDNLLGRMSDCGANEDVMPMSLVLRATTCDIITGYLFGKSAEYLTREDYNEDFFSSINAMFGMSWPHLTYISWLGAVLGCIPPSQWTKQIRDIRLSEDLKSNNSTVFHGILNGKLPPSEKSARRLRQEAQQLVLAGQDTTAQTVVAITFELLACPDKLAKLKAELASVFPDPDNITSAVCERLPYLHAVVQEGIRLHPATLVRMTRVAPNQEMIYTNEKENREWVIKPGTPVSMTAFTIQNNPDIFPSPRKFELERWLDNPRLDKYLLSFFRGTRICLGLYIAYFELYLILEGIFRRYDRYDGTGKQSTPTLELYDTIRERDIDAVVDLVLPYPAVGSKGLRVMIRNKPQNTE